MLTILSSYGKGVLKSLRMKQSNINQLKIALKKDVAIQLPQKQPTKYANSFKDRSSGKPNEKVASGS